MRATARMSFQRHTEAQQNQLGLNRRRLVYRFYLSMLGIAGIDLCFAIIYQIPVTRFLPTAIILVALTLTGAHLIFRPIQKFLRNPEAVAVPYGSIASLSYRCTALTAALIGALAVAKFVLLPHILDFDIESLLTRNELVWLPVLHKLYYTALIFL